MKNILMALACLLTFGFAKAGNDKPKCCTDKCSKQCVELCKKNNCTDKDCCKLCGQKGCQASACTNHNERTTASATSANAKHSDVKTETKTGACCEKQHK